MPISSSIIDIGMYSVHQGFSVVIVGISGINQSSSAFAVFSDRFCPRMQTALSSII